MPARHPTGSIRSVKTGMPSFSLKRVDSDPHAGPKKTHSITSDVLIYCWDERWKPAGVWDVIATARYLNTEFGGKSAIHVAGERTASILASQAALWETDIAGAILVTPPSSFMDAEAPQFLNILRTCDIAETLGLLAPRPLLIVDGEDGEFKKTAAIYAVAEAGSMFFEK